jgi:transcription antitermination factor NusA-like protein
MMANADEFFKYFDKVKVYMNNVNETGGADPQIELVWQQRGILFRVVWLSFTPLLTSSRG